MFLTADTEKIEEAINDFRRIMTDVKLTEQELKSANQTMLDLWSGISAQDFSKVTGSMETNFANWIQSLDTEIDLIQDYLTSLITEEVWAANQILLDIQGNGARQISLYGTDIFEPLIGFQKGEYK